MRDTSKQKNKMKKKIANKSVSPIKENGENEKNENTFQQRKAK